MTTTDLGHFDGIPDDFIRALNQRLRELQAIRQPKPVKARGAAGVLDENAIPKAGQSGGTLEESGLTDDGDEIAAAERIRVDTDASPTHSQFGVAAAGAGFLGLLVNGADDLALQFDVERVAGGAIARDASIASINKTGDKLIVRGSTGNTPGSAPAADNDYLTIDLATGAAILKFPSAQNVVTGSRALATTYQNTGASPMMVTVTLACTYAGGAAQANALTDSAATPTTVVASVLNGNPSTVQADLVFWVLPGNYYKVVQVSNVIALMIWTEWT